MPKLFTYGTLQNGQRNEWRMTGQKLIGKALTVKPYLFVNMGHYPGLVDKPGPSQVHGELYEVSKKNLRINDIFECVPKFYQRKEIEVTVDDVKYTTFVYFMNPWIAEEGFQIVGGVWAPDSALARLSGWGYSEG